MRNELLLSILLSIGFLLLSQTSHSQAPDLSNWKTSPFNSQSVDEANLSKNNWTFEKKDGRIIIKQNEYRNHEGDSLPFEKKFVESKLKTKLRNHYVKTVKNGYLIGIDWGEFSGGLYFLSQNGERAYEIDGYHRIQEIFEFNSKIYASAGLAHLGINEGNILELTHDNSWRITNNIKLPEKPSVLVFKDNQLFIVTSQFILKADKEMNVTTILESPVYWGVLYPKSAVINANNFYIAMRKGVLKIENFENGPQYKFYIPKQQ